MGLLFSKKDINKSERQIIILEYLIDGIVIVTVIICLYTDLKNRKIYNKVLVPALVIGVVLNVFLNGFQGLFNSILGLGLGFALLFIPFNMGGIGGGDVKLLMVIGAIKGWEFVLYTALGMGVFGGLIAIGILIKQGRIGKTFKEFLSGLKILIGSRFKIVSFNADDEKYMFPYGVAIALGVAAAMVILR